MSAATSIAHSGVVQSGTTVEYRDVHRVFGAMSALAGLSLRIEPGELLALLGPSGCGKTTALRLLAGFDRPTSGSLLIDGQDVSDVPANKRDMGMVFQSYSLFPTMSAQRQRRVRPADARPSRAAAARARRRAARTRRAGRTRQEVSRISCRAASSSGSRWPARWPSRRGCCCSTSRSPRWTPRSASSCATRSGGSSSSLASRLCSSRTTRRRRCRWPTGSA